MRQCGILMLLLLGIVTYDVSNVEGASFCEDDTIIVKACQDYLSDLKGDCQYQEANAEYCNTRLESSCFYKLGYVQKECEDQPTANEVKTIVDRCDEYKKCYTYARSLYYDCIPEDKQADAAYCDNSTEGSCINKLEFVLNVCNDETLKPDIVKIVTDKCVRLEKFCDKFSTDLDRCATQEVNAVYFCDNSKSYSCLYKLEFVQKRCKEKRPPDEVKKFADKCAYLKLACDVYLSDLKGECTQQQEADKNFCNKNASSSCSSMLEYVQKKCENNLGYDQEKRMKDKCDFLDKRCGLYLSDLKGDCAHQKSDAAAYCDVSVAGSCSNKLAFVQNKCFKTLTPDEEKKITDKCDPDLTTESTPDPPTSIPETTADPDNPGTTLSPVEHCQNYVTAMFDCWNDEKLFLRSCSFDNERYELLLCVNNARGRDEDNCNSDFVKQYNSNMITFLNATDKFLCGGETPKFDADCLDATVPKDIIVSSFAGDMNECGPLLETIEIFKAKLGKEKCKLLVDEYVVEIKKLDYCRPKRVTSEPCEKDEHGNIHLNILIGNGNHDNNMAIA